MIPTVRVNIPQTRRQCFVRFGELPSSGCSINYRDNEPLPGVCVWAADCVDEKEYWLYNTEESGMINTLLSCVTHAILAGFPIYEVTGTPIATGPHREPVLFGVQIVKKLNITVDGAIVPVQENT